MGRGKTATRSAALRDLKAHCLWDDQFAYEVVRPVVLKEQSLTERASVLGVTAKTMRQKVAQFIQFGIPSLVPTT